MINSTTLGYLSNIRFLIFGYLNFKEVDTAVKKYQGDSAVLTPFKTKIESIDTKTYDKIRLREHFGIFAGLNIALAFLSSKDIAFKDPIIEADPQPFSNFGMIDNESEENKKISDYQNETFVVELKGSVEDSNLDSVKLDRLKRLLDQKGDEQVRSNLTVNRDIGIAIQSTKTKDHLACVISIIVRKGKKSTS